MKISVITVSYNAEKTIEQTIQSVISQNYENLEYIIIDGASTDHTVDIIRKYEEKISYWVSEPDNGVYDAMNKGLLHCTGDVIAFLNSDDYYLPNVLHRVSGCFFQNADIDIVCGDVLFERDGMQYPYQNPYKNNPEKLREGFWMYSHQGIFAKKICFQQIGGFDTKYTFVADYNWLLKNYNFGMKIVYLPEYLVVFRWGGLSTNRMIETADETNKMVKQVAQDLFNQKIICAEDYDKLAIKIQREYLLRMLYAYSENIDLIRLNAQVQVPFFNNKVKYSIFGAGKLGQAVLKILKALGFDVLLIWDNNTDKWTEKIEGVPICNPADITNTNTMVVIASHYYEESIRKQLASMKLIEERHYVDCRRLCQYIQLKED